MPIAINGSGTVTGVSVGGLPDGIVDADMLADDAVTDAKQNLSGAAKAWVNFDGTSSGTNKTLSDSFNISSVTESSTGQYTVNLNTAMANANYCVVQGSNNFGGNNNAAYLKVDNLTTSSFTVVIVASAVFVDRSIICMAVFGDQ
tara:strand:+ start:1809 stop:2243 length:435 start_codon:yes stop_codon:yes gene_type:complete